MSLALIIVSGAPGSGKTTLAGPLAAALGLPLIAKDVIKETVCATLPRPPGQHDALAWSRAVGAASMEVLWALASQPAPVMLEANFRPQSSSHLGRLLDQGRVVVEVWCHCPNDLAAQRYAARAREGRRDARTHVITALTPEMLAEFTRPVGVGELVEVDTSVPVDVADVAARVRAIWKPPPRAGRAQVRTSTR